MQNQAKDSNEKMESSQVALRLPVDRRKPPLSQHHHSHRSSVINLDKNRIRHARRLLPRPLSLPSGFNLMRQLGISNVNENPETSKTPTIDLAEIKKLEDDIYNRKRGSSTNSADQPKICRLGSECSKCNIKGGPDQCRESAASQAIMLLDAWQLDPLLRKYSKPALKICSSPSNDVLKPLPPHIYKNSNIEQQNQHGSTVPTRDPLPPGPLPQLLSGDVKRRPIKSSFKRHSKTIFQRCITSGTTTDDEGDLQMITQSDLSTELKEVSTGKVSKFKRFIMHRRSLNLSRHNDTSAIANNKSVPDRFSFGVFAEPATTKLPMLNEELPISVDSRTVGTLRRGYRQWRSDDDIYETMDRRPRNVQRPSRRIDGQPEDINAKLIDLDRMQQQLDQLSVDLAKRRQMLLSDGGDGNVKDGTKRQRSPSMLLLFQNNTKRHSIGSPTDLVRTWKYRRR